MIAYRALPGMRFRTRPPGVVEGPIGSGTLDLPRRLPARAGARDASTFKFTVTGPHMLAKTLLDRHYARHAPKLAHAIADVLAEQVQHLDADVVQLDEANLPGHPDEWEWAASAINTRPRRRSKTTAGGAPVLRQLRRPERPAAAPGSRLMRYLNALTADHVVLESAHRPPEELAVFRG